MVVRTNNKWKQYKDLANLIDIQRIMDTIEQLGALSASPGNGVTRLAYSTLYIEAKNLIANLMVEAGLEIAISPIGNTFGRLAPNNCQNSAVLTGSHTDTVVYGGRFDGVVGVVCAIEVLRVLHQIKDKLTYPIEVVDFAMEESARFGAVYGFGSYVLTGGVVDKRTLLLKDHQDITLVDAIQEINKLTYYPKNNTGNHLTNLERVLSYIEQSRRRPEEIKAFLELHIEQGQELEELNIPIGVVTGTAAPTRLRIELVGQQSHSGTTPMHKRKNALSAAAEIVLMVDELCNQEAKNGTVGAITEIVVEPNVMNTVPGRALMSLDLRGTSRDSKQQVLKALYHELDYICSKRGIEANVQVLVDEAPIEFSQVMMEALEESCAVVNISSCRIPSRAGHDSCHMSKLVDKVGMIFVPSRGGISHNPSEWTNAEDIQRGAQVLLLTLLQLAIE